MKKTQSLFGLMILGALSLSSCVKKTFDAPPDTIAYDPGVKVTATISQINAKYGAFGKDSTITEDWTVAGIITADDRSGNFYKQINIEDSTGAVGLLINAYSLYAHYPIGRKVYLNLKGMHYGFYSKLPQLGGPADQDGSISGLTGADIDAHIVKANVTGNTVPVHEFNGLASLKTANASMLNRLVKINNVEFAGTAIGLPYAQDPIVATGTSRNIEDSLGNIIAVRTSGYANFRAFIVPRKRGTIYGIYTVYGTTAQLIIRDTNDVQFTKSRFGEINGTILLQQSFENETNNATVAINGWTNFSETGTVKYRVATYSNNKYASVTAYQAGTGAVKSWLITPALNTASLTNPRLVFRTIDGYDNGATLKVYVSTNYTGTNPTTATWTQLTAPISTGHTSGYASAFTNSGDISLNNYKAGNVYVAFVYEGVDPSKTTTYEIDDVTVYGD